MTDAQPPELPDAKLVLAMAKAPLLAKIGVASTEIRRLERKLEEAKAMVVSLMNDVDSIDKALGLL